MGGGRAASSCLEPSADSSPEMEGNEGLVSGGAGLPHPLGGMLWGLPETLCVGLLAPISCVAPHSSKRPLLSYRFVFAERL